MDDKQNILNMFRILIEKNEMESVVLLYNRFFNYGFPPHDLIIQIIHTAWYFQKTKIFNWLLNTYCDYIVSNKYHSQLGWLYKMHCDIVLWRDWYIKL
jgi:hypothetical protein